MNPYHSINISFSGVVFYIYIIITDGPIQHNLFKSSFFITIKWPETILGHMWIDVLGYSCDNCSIWAYNFLFGWIQFFMTGTNILNAMKEVSRLRTNSEFQNIDSNYGKDD